MNDQCLLYNSQQVYSWQVAVLAGTESQLIKGEKCGFTDHLMMYLDKI